MNTSAYLQGDWTPTGIALGIVGIHETTSPHIMTIPITKSNSLKLCTKKYGVPVKLSTCMCTKGTVHCTCGLLWLFVWILKSVHFFVCTKFVKKTQGTLNLTETSSTWYEQNVNKTFEWPWNMLVFVCSVTWPAAFQITSEDVFCGYATLLFIIMLKLILLKKIDVLIAILYYWHQI